MSIPETNMQNFNLQNLDEYKYNVVQCFEALKTLVMTCTRIAKSEVFDGHMTRDWQERYSRTTSESADTEFAKPG